MGGVSTAGIRSAGLLPDKGLSALGFGRRSVFLAPISAAGPIFDVPTRSGGSHRDIEHRLRGRQNKSPNNGISSNSELRALIEFRVGRGLPRTLESEIDVLQRATPQEGDGGGTQQM